MKTQDILIAHPKTAEQVNALKAVMRALKIKFEISKARPDSSAESPYNPEFVVKIEKSRKDYKDGKGTVITMDELDNLWK